MPTMPQKEAGMRRDPPKSTPVPSHTCKALLCLSPVRTYTCKELLLIVHLGGDLEPAATDVRTRNKKKQGQRLGRGHVI